MGTPEIAAFCLNKIHSEFGVTAVVTAVDKPAGRGKKIKFSDVKKIAIEKNIPLLQPKNLKSNDFINQLKTFNPDLIVVVAFRMLPKDVWALPKLGTINLHASLLPDYRGAAPINWAIINGENKTGVTTFFIDEQIDTGKIILQKEIPIDFEDNAGTLHDKIMFAGSDLLIETIDLIKSGNVKTIEQNKLIQNTKPKLAPKINKNDCKINWDNEPIKIYNFIRGMSPFPGAWSVLILNNKKINTKIFGVKPISQTHNYSNGQIITKNKKAYIAVNQGFIEIISLRLEGKKTISGEQFAYGYNLENAKFL